jgi:peptide/nickel transport system substrate-binding protein
MRKDYTVGLTVSENGLDDPDQQFYENFVCGAERNYTGYCSSEVDALVDRQSTEPDPAKRKRLVSEIERKLAEDGGRPVIFIPGLGSLLAALLQGSYDDGQRQLQWLAPRRRLA